MQTFMPLPSFDDSLKCLDNKRLGKQRVEAFQILNILLNRTDTKGWRSHPAMLMWRGYEDALKLYYNLSLHYWIQRGFRNNMKIETLPYCLTSPHWMGNKDFHASHRSNLLRKDPNFYGQYRWKELDNLPYVWPKGRE